MLAPANYCFLHQELCFFVCLQPVKKLHSATLKYKSVSKLVKTSCEMTKTKDANISEEIYVSKQVHYIVTF